MNSSGLLGSPTPEVGTETTLVLPLILATICLLGFTGNLLLIATLLHDVRSGKCSLANLLVIHVGATDLLLLALCLPMLLVSQARQSWVLGHFACRTSDWFVHSCHIVKSLTLAAISHARYRHVLSPPRLQPVSGGRAGGLLLLSWSLALLLPLPQLLFSRLEEEGGRLRCELDIPARAEPFMAVFSKLYPLLVYVLPAAFTMGCYTRALQRRRERRKRLCGQRAGSRRTTAMLLAVALAFHALWLPQWLVWLWARHGSAQPPASMLVLAQVLLFADCALPPGLFLAVSPDFRDSCWNAWPLARCRPPHDNSSDMATIQSLHDLPSTRLAPRGPQDTRDGKFLPDVEHFWQDRRNTTAGEDNDPMPWEHQTEP
ncbi:probable G- coupled receptor 151 [Pelobates cultripes]|uniref:Probable G- coupled receptor 151 n=1 Tax=Pelobates cultripes TaxID=61616 RepID=A0AAD1WWU1_PELCU|nr:probable G- coupled receptor 151 [Pelobates cultripes]